MNIKQSAAVSAILMVIALTGVGCLRSFAPVAPEPVATPTIVTNKTKPEVSAQPERDIPALRHAEIKGSMTTTVSGDTTIVRDERTKVAFSYPTSLGEIETRNEFGVGMETDIETATTFDCLEQRAFNVDGTAFLVVNDTWQCQTLGRMGYWGDQARLFSTEDDVKEWCETKGVCVPYVNPNGVTIYHAYTKSVDFFGETLFDIDEYGAWNPNKDISGVLVSNQGFVQAGLGRTQEEVKAVADSLSFFE